MGLACMLDFVLLEAYRLSRACGLLLCLAFMKVLNYGSHALIIDSSY